jgi:hypothetical protein
VSNYFFFSSLALIIVFAWMEPAGAAGLGFGKGLIFWSIQISILIPLLIAVQHLASKYLILKTTKDPWIQTLISGVIAASAFVPVGYLLDILFAIPDDASSLGILNGMLDEASGVIVPVTVTWLALNAPWILQLDFSKDRDIILPEDPNTIAKSGEDQTAESSRFLEELRRRTAGDLICITSELHYVRVVTTDSEVMFLYNLRDAIDELSSDAGIQIHRSHWVARGHIREIIRKKGNFECTLSNGKKLPVSRRKYSEIKALLGS